MQCAVWYIRHLFLERRVKGTGLTDSERETLKDEMKDFSFEKVIHNSCVRELVNFST